MNDEEVETFHILLRSLGLPGRAVNALLAAGHNTPERIAIVSDAELLRLPNLGPRTLAAIRHVIQRLEAPTPTFASAEAMSREIERFDGLTQSWSHAQVQEYLCRQLGKRRLREINDLLEEKAKRPS